jgi:hypothetical protein
MKRAVVVVRMGVSDPTLGDIKAMHRLTNGSMNAMGAPFPVGLVSVLYTDLSTSDINQVFKDVEDEVGDVLPVIVFNYGDPNITMDLRLDNIEDMMREVDKFVEDQKPIIYLTLDEILDKISRTGVESLDSEELALLKSFAKGKN